MVCDTWCRVIVTHLLKLHRYTLLHQRIDELQRKNYRRTEAFNLALLRKSHRQSRFWNLKSWIPLFVCSYYWELKKKKNDLKLFFFILKIAFYFPPIWFFCMPDQTWTLLLSFLEIINVNLIKETHFLQYLSDSSKFYAKLTL